MEDVYTYFLKEGSAFDTKKDSDKLKEHIKDKIGWMQISDIDDIILKWVNIFSEKEVCLLIDVDMSLLEWQMKVLPNYLDLIIKNFENKLKEIVNKDSSI